MAKATYEQQQAIGKLSSDCSPLLTHLVRQNDGRSDADARRTLHSILGLWPETTPKLLARHTGWYGSESVTPRVFSPEKARLLETNEYDKSQLQCVCFTESTLEGLKAHNQIFKAKYGLAFSRDFLLGKGANPCLNLREELLKKSIKSAYDQYDRHVYNFIPMVLHPYVNVINHGFDATHEREWRHVGDLTFSREDIRYVFCPRAEQEEFSSRLGTISGLQFHDLESPEDVVEHTPCLS
ncbi:MAG: hypothetical protein ABFE13_24195 [Phycisphaerales bacterium]